MAQGRATSRLYSAVITSEQFLFYEMRITARLMADGLSDEEVKRRIISENLYQYPTERSVGKIAQACVRRLRTLPEEALITAIATEPPEVARQLCLYAMMKQSHLVCDFMVTVVGGEVPFP